MIETRKRLIDEINRGQAVHQVGFICTDISRCTVSKTYEKNCNKENIKHTDVEERRVGRTLHHITNQKRDV
jgi:hypothetical protein